MITRRLEFDKLDQLYTALRDIDNVENSKSDCKLDDVWNVIKDIDKTQFDDGIEDDIVSSIRSAIEKIYLNYFNQVNSVIGLTPDDFKKEEDNNSLKVVGIPQVHDTRNEEENNPHKKGNEGNPFKDVKITGIVAGKPQLVSRNCYE